MVELFETLLLLKGLTMFFSDFSQKRKKITPQVTYDKLKSRAKEQK